MRVVGVLLILLAAALACLRMRTRARVRERQLAEWVQLLTYLEGEIAYAARPAGEVLAGFPGEALEECGFLPLARARGLAAAVDNCGGLLLAPPQKQAANEFAAALGTRFREEEAEKCRRLRQSFAAELEREQRETPPRLRVHCRLCLCGAAVAVLLFL